MTQQNPPSNALKTIILFVGFLMFTGIFGTLLCGMWYGQLQLIAVLDDGYPTDAILENKYIQNEQHFWFTYRFTTITDDTYLSSIEVSESVYENYALGGVLPMRYVLDNPNWNALDLMHDDIRGAIWGVFGLSIVVVSIAIGLAYLWLRHLTLTRIQSLFRIRR